MKVEPNLKWMKSLGDYSDGEKKILFALSHERYQWRTASRLAASTGLSEKDTESALSSLIAKQEVRISRSSKSKNLIFGIRQRVG